MGYKDPEKKRTNDLAYREKNREKINIKKREYYQKNKESINRRVSSYAKENATRIKEYQKEYYQKTRLGVLSRIDSAMKCAMCGCEDTRFLEINHIHGGGNKELRVRKGENHNSSQNIVELIHKGKRGVKDLNLLCRVCNSIDHLERVYGKTGLRTVWDKQVS